MKKRKAKGENYQSRSANIYITSQQRRIKKTGGGNHQRNDSRKFQRILTSRWKKAHQISNAMDENFTHIKASYQKFQNIYYLISFKGNEDIKES